MISRSRLSLAEQDRKTTQAQAQAAPGCSGEEHRAGRGAGYWSKERRGGKEMGDSYPGTAHTEYEGDILLIQGTAPL